MGLENLKSVFANLPNTPSVSPENESMNPTLDLKGRHGGLTSDIFPSTPPHPDDHSTLDDLIKQTIPIKMDENSLLSIQDDSIEFNSYYDASFIGPYSGFSGRVTADNNNPTQISFNPIDDRKKLRTGDEFLKLGVNNRLGEGELILETLYNTDHTAVMNRQPIDIGKKDHEGNAIYINPGREGIGSLGNLDINKYRSGLLDNFRGFDRGAEPYSIQPIGSDRYATLTSRDTLPLHRALDDVSRLANFYTSDAGKWYMAKENITNMLIGNSNQLLRGDTILAPPIPNPIQGNTGFLNITNDPIQDLGGFIGSLRKPFTIEYSSGAGKWYFFKNLGDRTIGIEQLQKIKVPTDKPKWVQKGLQKLKDGAIKKAAKSIQLPLIDKTPFIDLKGGPRPTSYDDKVNAITPRPFELYEDTFAKGDFYVKIKDLRTGGKFLYFRGFVTGIVENVSPTWTPTNYIGRSEPVYMYERAERDLSFNLRVYPNNEIEFNAMYEKIEYLTSLAYPKYLEQDNMMRMQPPFTELYMAHIGSKKQGQFGFIKSLSYTVNDSGDWDALQALPRLFDIAISYQILNKKPPSMSDDGTPIGNFYRLTS